MNKNMKHDQRIGVERERSRKSRSSALNPRTAYFKILMRKGKVQVFRIRRIMLILAKLNNKITSS
jgi:hypothetical protein